MRQKIFAIMGATGHIGHVIVEDLLKRGHIVRALGRDERKLHELELKGAVPVLINAEDATALTEAFRDAYAVFSLIPPATTEENYSAHQDQLSQAICRAISDAGVTRVVNLSSLGGSLPDGTGPIKGLHAHEERLNLLPNLTTLVHLRPGFFMENLNSFIPLIETKGEIRSPLFKDKPIAMCSTRDIGWKAADFLDDTAAHPHLIFEFVGPKEVTMQHAADLFSQVLDMPVRYVQLSFDEARREMIESGMQPSLVELYLEMYNAFNSGLIAPTQELKPSHHGTTTLDEFIRMVVHKLYAHIRI